MARDINPRVAATFGLFMAQIGMDGVRGMYLDLAGQAVPSAPPREGRKWVVENGDLISFNDYRRDGKITFWQWIRSFRGVEEGAWSALDNMAPFRFMASALFWVFLRCVGGRVGVRKAPMG